jgi:hypothetical protein
MQPRSLPVRCHTERGARSAGALRCSAQSARSTARTARGAKRRPLLHLQELSAARRTSLVHCAGPQGSGPARSRGAPARLADWQAAGEPPTESLTFPRKISCPDSGKGAKSIFKFKPIRDAHGNFHECVRVSLALRFTGVLPNASGSRSHPDPPSSHPEPPCQTPATTARTKVSDPPPPCCRSFAAPARPTAR